eukprot:m.108952 g.108952  ORF g.108952 m.108952 type:complete len:51 (+) comp15336_c0_seq71:551-703(+)
MQLTGLKFECDIAIGLASDASMLTGTANHGRLEQPMEDTIAIPKYSWHIH